MAPPFRGVVLSGGNSSRMGADKATIAIDGVPMVRRVADALLAAGATSVVAVGGDGPSIRAAGVEVLADRWPGEGPLAAVAQSLAAPDGDDVVAVLACDLLRPDPATIASLVDRREETDADVVVPVADGRAQWVHAVWHRRVAGVLAAVFESGERSLVGATAGLRAELVVAERPHLLADADRPAQLPAGASFP